MPPNDNDKRQKQVRFNENIIVPATTAKITVTKIFMHLWHLYLVMTNVLVEILATVRN